MKLHYMGKYSGDENDLPHGEHKPGAVAFREPDMKKTAIIINIVGNAVAIALVIAAYIIWQTSADERASGSWQICLAALCSLLALFPHEIIHALCFKKDVYLYTNLKQGMLFVVGPEDLSKLRFILMSLAPNIVFGFIPFILFLVFPNMLFLGTFGAISIGCGAGDYMNVINALIQMPKGARTYLYGFHSYWYMPQD